MCVPPSEHHCVEQWWRKVMWSPIQVLRMTGSLHCLLIGLKHDVRDQGHFLYHQPPVIWLVRKVVAQESIIVSVQ